MSNSASSNAAGVQHHPNLGALHSFGKKEQTVGEEAVHGTHRSISKENELC